ncbi:MAG: TIGR03960 family B12-binding radical SAM protein [Candidatus Hydrogenedentes bacterium]|nr:TIGR03960 family B12-binding radical SAM protein [Candidatus Hydrogenedentota bacterium]
MNLAKVLTDEILSRVEKPSRYVGNELNTVHKNPAEVELRVCFFFPDLYELGLGNLGIHILYAILNELDWVWAERAYSPAPDMEAILRERELPLFMHESKDSLDVCDLIGFTLQSELTFTNIINAIDMAGMALRTADRPEDAPLIFAGGPAVFNPEPIAPFIDFFVIGEGEDVILEIVEALRPLKGATRTEKLKVMAQIEGVYVPSLYPFETMPDGQILPREDAPKIVKRLVQTLDGAHYPTKYIVPFTQLVHDGIGLEVLRGCTQGCRFCQAGMVTRPVRERTLKNIDYLMEETLKNTGFEAVSLVSLSTCDFSRPRTLVKQAAARAHKDNVSISLPSLRLDSFAVEMADMVSGVRRSGLTFAPEAATPRLRAVINKFIPDEGLLTMAAEAYRRGWDHVKTYFMIGLPTERDEDVIAIADLAIRTVQMGRKINPRAGVRTGVSTFVPKPFTPFQWAPQISMEETWRKQGMLEAKFSKHPSIKFGRHDAKTSFIEGLITRADRRGADLLEAAWRNGARLETWDEYVNFPAWQKAIEETGYNVEEQFRERDIHERLPWDHIDLMIPKTWFQEDWQRALDLKYAQDCRAGKCHLCGVIYRERELCKHMLKNQKAGQLEEEDTWEGVSVKELEQPDAVQRVRFRIGRTGEVRYLAHLELKDVWIRALRRARVRIAYSQGFHAQAKVTFSTAVPVGEESLGDYMDVMFSEAVDVTELLNQLKVTLPLNFHLFDAFEVPMKTPSLMSAVRGFAYAIHVEADSVALKSGIQELLSRETILVERKLKVRKKTKGKRFKRRDKEMGFVDVRPLIETLRIREANGTQAIIEMVTLIQGAKLAKPKEILSLLGIDPLSARVVKEETFLAEARLVEAVATE